MKDVDGIYTYFLDWKDINLEKENIAAKSPASKWFNQAMSKSVEEFDMILLLC